MGKILITIEGNIEDRQKVYDILKAEFYSIDYVEDDFKRVVQVRT